VFGRAKRSGVAEGEQAKYPGPGAYRDYAISSRLAAHMRYGYIINRHCSYRTSVRELSQHTQPTPGPGAYSVVVPTKHLRKGYSIAGRPQDSGKSSGSPGPAAYNPSDKQSVALPIKYT
jgi:hypothetical protein